MSELQSTPYVDLTEMPRAGRWRGGSGTEAVIDSDPYTAERLTELAVATTEDVDEAHQAARGAQTEWAAATSTERAGVFLRAAEVLDQRQEELVGWLTREAGTTRIRALVEICIVRATMMAAVAHTSLGETTVTSDVPGKENQVCARPTGVLCVISPWNFPMHLSHRSVAPAQTARRRTSRNRVGIYRRPAKRVEPGRPTRREDLSVHRSGVQISPGRRACRLFSAVPAGWRHRGGWSRR
jgi:hypothetical protein